VNVRDALDTLEFENHSSVHDQVESVADIELYAIVFDRQSDFTFYKEAILDELMFQASLISTLEQTRT
jgi:hypothetical protein